MNINNFKAAFPYLHQANVVPFIWGPQGVGKTSVMRQLAEELGYNLVVLHLGQMADAGDLIGLPEIIRETDPEKIKAGIKGSTVFMKPDWVPTEGKWIIFFDEFNRARRDIIQCVFQFILEKKNHSVSFPKDTIMAAAGNPNTEEFIVTDISDAALLDRFVHVKLQPTVSEWVDHAVSTKFAPEVITFIRQQEGTLGNSMPDFDLGIKPSPRSWDAVSRLFKVKTPEYLMHDLTTGLVGVSAATAFMESIKSYDQPVKALDVLNNFEQDDIKARVQKYSSENDTRQDLLKVTTDDLLKELEELKAVTKQQEANVMAYLMTIPVEMMFIASKELFTINDWMKRMVANKTFVGRLESNVEPIKAKLKELEAAKEKADAADKSGSDQAAI